MEEIQKEFREKERAEAAARKATGVAKPPNSDFITAHAQPASRGTSDFFVLDGVQHLVIDRERVLQENNKAERQCQDNKAAFYHYKK